MQELRTEVMGTWLEISDELTVEVFQLLMEEDYWEIGYYLHEKMGWWRPWVLFLDFKKKTAKVITRSKYETPLPVLELKKKGVLDLFLSPDPLTHERFMSLEEECTAINSISMEICIREKIADLIEEFLRSDPVVKLVISSIEELDLKNKRVLIRFS